MSEAYVYGAPCTWHGPLAKAGERADKSPCCPKCGGDVKLVASEELWWAFVRDQAAKARDTFPEYEAMVRWSQGRCFPDFDTLVNAYRQAMEGTR